MRADLAALHVLLAATAFLAILNGYLRGRLKPKIDAFLSLLFVGTLIGILLLHGWRAALLALPLSFVYGAILTPLARKTAQRLLGYRTSLETGTEYSDLHALTSGKLSFDEYMTRSTAKRQREDAELSRVVASSAIAPLLQRLGKTQRDVADLVTVLTLTGVGRELALRVVSNPRELEELLAMRAAGRAPVEIAAHVMQQ